MNDNEILLLGIGIQSPRQLFGQRLDTDKTPHELHFEVKAVRGSKFPCPDCGKDCSAHDFKQLERWHLADQPAFVPGFASLFGFHVRLLRGE